MDAERRAIRWLMATFDGWVSTVVRISWLISASWFGPASAS
jgi:hypothetical protein